MPIYFFIVRHSHKSIRHNFKQSALWGIIPFSIIEADGDGEKTIRLKLRRLMFKFLHNKRINSRVFFSPVYTSKFSKNVPAIKNQQLLYITLKWVV
jgi:hypothetical protein